MQTADPTPETRRRRRKASHGMTLIEIMVVLAIISLILGGVGVMAFNRYKDAQLDDAKHQVVQIQQLVEQFKLAKRKCPKNIAELKSSGYAAKVAKDPWGTDYEVRCDADLIEVTSAGPDGTPGTDDDISSSADESTGEIEGGSKKPGK